MSVTESSAESRSGGPGAAAPRRRGEAERCPVRTGDGGFSEGLLYALLSYMARIAMTIFFDARVYGAHRVPGEGPAILASNHASFLDPVLIGSSFTRRCCYLARDSLFRIPGLGALIRAVDTVPVARESVSARQAVDVCVRILAAGRLLLLFPEGTRSRDGYLAPLRRGIGLIVRRSGAPPVVPVRVVGSYECWPRHKKLFRCRPVRIFFGNPLHYDENKESVDAFLGRLRCSMESLGREELGGEDLGPSWPGRHPGPGVGSPSPHVSTGSAAGGRP